MARSVLVLLHIDRESPVPLYKQVQDQIREHILDGRLKPGCSLPSARILAIEWGISRITTESAYSHLMAEGYVNRRVGAGTFVAKRVPDIALVVDRRSKYLGEVNGLLAGQGDSPSIERISVPGGLVTAPFQSGLPDLGTLPMLWRRLIGRQLSRLERSNAGYGDPAGLELLRNAIADHVTSHRGVRCVPEQIVVTAGAQQGIDLCGRLILEPGDEVWVEDPCYAPAVASFRSAGAKIVPVPVDEEGMIVTAGRNLSEKAKLAYITPSHQYPLGVSMSMRRRIQLLEWASATRSWIVEDDYDSEFRYCGQPIEALQGLDQSGCVIYVGTFSKILFPALRIGYVVLPYRLVCQFVSAKALADRHGVTMEQGALAEFILDGHFSAHLRRMRKLYAIRQEILFNISEEYWGNSIIMERPVGGLFMLGRLSAGLNDVEIARRAMLLGVRVRPLSPLYLTKKTTHGFLFGFAAYTEKEMHVSAKKFATALTE